jgi:gluconokinase
MSSGIPLTDEDRKGWLSSLQEAITKWILSPNTVVFLACSALKKSYRGKGMREGNNDKHNSSDILANGNPNVFFIYLQGSKDLIKV